MSGIAEARRSVAGHSAGRLVRIAGLVALAITLAITGCSRKKTYSQETPDDVIRSAVEMVKNGDASRLGDLIYADSGEMRLTLDRLGELFGHMQALGKAVAARFPDEMRELKDRAAQAAAEGKPDPLLSMLGGGLGGGARGGGVRVSGQTGAAMDEDAMEELFNRLFADPYGWLEQNAARLSALKTSDDTASIMLDNQPIIPVVGLPMRLENGKWYVTLPTNFPGIADAMPRSREQWQILVHVIKVLDKTVVEMTDDVNAGRVATLDGLAKKAREKAIMPGVLALAAYGKEMEVRARVDRRVKQFQTRWRDWVKARSGGKDDDKPDVSAKLSTVLNRLAPSRLEPLVRKRTAPTFDKMSDGELESLVGAWLKEAGINVRLDGDLSDEVVAPEIQRWESAQPRAGNIARVKQR